MSLQPPVPCPRNTERYVQLFLMMSWLSTPVAAQQTLFNLPTPDILPRGGIYGELDNTFALAQQKSVGVEPRIVAGIGHDFEIGLNFLGVTAPGKPSLGLEPVVKWGRGPAGFRFTLTNYLAMQSPGPGESGVTARHMAIAHFSRATRVGKFVVGGYNATRGLLAHGDRAGMTAEYMKPIFRGLTFGSEWLSGNHSLGLLNSGLTYSVGRHSFYLSYELGNHNGHRNGVEFEYGFRFR